MCVYNGTVHGVNLLAKKKTCPLVPCFDRVVVSCDMFCSKKEENKQPSPDAAAHIADRELNATVSYFICKV